MQASNIPTKIPTPFANAAGGSFIRTVPVPSQIGITDGAASYTDGFPPDCFKPVAAGGVPPFGQDFNGLLNVVTAWLRWVQAGGAPVDYDSSFQSSIGGYPNGAVVGSVTNPVAAWMSTVDNNVTNPDAGGAGWVSYGGQQTGQCVLTLSGGNLLLSPKGGNALRIAGALQSIPSAGITLSSGGLSASTFYYIYAFMNSGTMTLEASTTTHATDTTLGNVGIEIKSGNNTRTLVGIAFTTGSAAFSTHLVRSYFNRSVDVQTTSETTANLSINSSGSFVTIDAANTTASFVCFADDFVSITSGNNPVFQGSSNWGATATIFVDGVSVAQLASVGNVTAASLITALPAIFQGTLSEGHHTSVPAIATNSGCSANYNSGGSGNCTLNVTVAKG